MIPVDFERQLLPGSFELALCHRLDHERDLSALRERSRNDAAGAPVFDPAVLLKIVLLGYSRGLSSARAERDGLPCRLRHQCLGKPDTTKTRQEDFFLGKRGSPRSMGNACCGV